MIPAALAAPPLTGSAAVYSLAAAGMATLGAVVSAWLNRRPVDRPHKTADELTRHAERLDALDERADRLAQALERVVAWIDEEARPADRAGGRGRGPVRRVPPPQSE